jgi:tetratricopeptide (TPR) repeat protein
MSMKRAAFVALIVFALLASVTPAGSPAQDPIEHAFEAYAAGDHEAISRLISGTYFRRATVKERRRALDGLLARWDHERGPVRATFVLELAGHALPQDLSAVDVLARGRDFIISRPDPPGKNAREDAFETMWHKAAVALLGRLRAPDVLERTALEPLEGRLAAAPGRGAARLVDSWVALARAMLEEQRTIAEPSTLRHRASSTLQLFDRAAAHAPNKPEATVRKAWLLVRLQRPAEAITAFDSLGAIEDPWVLYWHRLFRGRALEELGRADDAATSYTEALTVFPGAQAAAAALTALEVRRGRFEPAFAWHVAGRTSGGDRVDPWLLYGAGDYRFFDQRLAWLRENSR